MHDCASEKVNEMIYLRPLALKQAKRIIHLFSEKEGRTFGLPLNWGQNVRIYLTEFSTPMTMLTKIIFNEFWSFWAPYSRVPKWGNDRIYVLGARDLFWRLRKF